MSRRQAIILSRLIMLVLFVGFIKLHSLSYSYGICEALEDRYRQDNDYVLPSVSGVRVISSKECKEAKCHLLGIICEGIPERKVLVREFQPTQPKGTIIFTVGGHGNSLYSL